MVEKLRDVSVAARTIQRDQVPEDVVGAVVFLCGPGSDFVTGPDDRHRRRPVLPLRLSLYEHPGGVETAAGNRVVYDVERNEAYFGAARVDGHALVWELDGDDEGALLSREVELDPATPWLVRCDRDRLPARRDRLPAHPPGPGHPLPALRRAARSRRWGDGARLRARRGRGSSAATRSGRSPPRPRRRRRPSCASCCCRPSGRASGRSATSTRPTRRSRSSSAPTVFLDQPLALA